MYRKWLLSLVFCFLASLLYAQRTEDVLYLKNGKVLRGTVIEENADGSIKLKSTDQSIHLIDAASVRKRSQETIEIYSPAQARRDRLAQAQKLANYSFGYFGGFTISTFTQDGVTPDSRMGGHLGLFVENPLNDRFSIVPEFQLSMRGGKYDYKDLQYDVDDLDPGDERYNEGHGVDTESLFDVHRNDLLLYLHVPVLVQAKWQLQQGCLFASAGIYGSYGLYSHTFDIEQNQYNRKENPPFYYNVYKNFDFGVACRLGWQTKGQLFLQAGFERGLMDIKPTTTWQAGETRFSIKNVAFSFSVGRRFK